MEINKYTRKWLGLPPGLSDAAMYCRQAKLKLLLKSITEEFKSGKVRLRMMLDDSKDKEIKSLNPTLKTGWKWKIKDAKENRAFKEVIGYSNRETRFLGVNEKKWSQANVKDRRDRVIQEVRNEEDNKRLIKGVQQPQQGQWTSWEEALQRSITWNDIWQKAPLKFNFLIRSTYDQLLSKSNLVKWKKESDPTCSLCNEKPQTLEYVLSSCKTALANGRYTWRYNIVLDELVRIIRNLMMPESNKSTQKFVAGRGKIYISSKKPSYHQAIPGQNLLGLGNNWILSADLPGWRNDHPKMISSKGLRPEMVLFSKENSKVILVELTILFESRLEQSHDYKTSKYEDLKKELEKKGYSVIVKAMEIGASGFVAGTLYQFLGKIGFNRHNRSKSMKRLTEITENSSMWI